jgi:hypothetical protein
MTARSEVCVIVVVDAFEEIVAFPAVTLPPVGPAAAGFTAARYARSQARPARFFAAKVFIDAAG